jgi:hypothetical protein
MLRAFRRDRSLAPVAKLWVPTLTLSLVLSYPMLNLFGIRWNNFGYHATEQVVVLTTIIMNGLLSHAFLRLAKMRSDAHETTLLYTTVVIYTPITTVMAIPSSYKLYSQLQILKHLNLEPQELFKRMFSSGLLGSIESFDLYALTVYVTGFIGILTLTVYAECLIQWYENPRFKTYLAVGIAAYTMFLAYRSLAEPFHRFLIYSFVE